MKTEKAKKEYLEKKSNVKQIIVNANNEESKKLTTDLVKDEGLPHVYQMVKHNRMGKKKLGYILSKGKRWTIKGDTG